MYGVILANPLLDKESNTLRVTVYFFSDRWTPILYLPLQEAIQIHREALESGCELFIFPANLNPDAFMQFNEPLQGNKVHK